MAGSFSIRRLEGSVWKVAAMGIGSGCGDSELNSKLQCQQVGRIGESDNRFRIEL